MDVTDHFNVLDVNGVIAVNFAFEVRKKLVLELMDMRPVYETTEVSVSNCYELQFNRVLDGRVEVEAPWLGEIKRWRAYRDSKLLAESLRVREHLTYGEAFTHFELIFDQARFDVVARDYFLTALDKVTTNRNGDGSGTGIPLSTSNEPKDD